jgi:AraC-like DNA-binding protein
MNPGKIKHEFFRRVDDQTFFQELLDLLPDVAFFVKDRQCRFVMNNARGVEVCGASSEAETIGKQGHEFFSEDLMAMYLEQDRQVMETGTPIINAVCPAPQKGSNVLIVYSKVPVRDPQGQVIGVAGIHREIRGMNLSSTGLGRMARAVQMIEQRYAEPLTICQLAEEAGLSRSQFDRQFRRLYGTAPREYLLRTRVRAACRRLRETDDPVTAIAIDTGFYDHSHLSRTFRRFTGSSPTLYRKRHASQQLLKPITDSGPTSH